MNYLIELTAKNVQVDVAVDAAGWPRKRAKQQAMEALGYLSDAVKVAIEGAPHVGAARELIDASPVMGMDEEADRTLGPAEVGKPVAAQVGPVTWEAIEIFVKAVKLPEGVALAEAADGVPTTRLSDTERKALIFVGEDRAGGGTHAPEIATVEVDFDLEPDEIAARMLTAANQVLEAVKLRDAPATEGTEGEDPS